MVPVQTERAQILLHLVWAEFAGVPHAIALKALALGFLVVKPPETRGVFEDRPFISLKLVAYPDFALGF